MNRTTRAEAATHSAFTASCHPPSKSLNDSNKHSSFHQSPDESILTDTRLPPFDRLRTPLHDPCHSLPAHPAHGHRCNNKRRQQMMKQSQPTPDIRQSACCCPHLFILFRDPFHVATTWQNVKLSHLLLEKLNNLRLPSSIDPCSGDRLFRGDQCALLHWNQLPIKCHHIDPENISIPRHLFPILFSSMIPSSKESVPRNELTSVKMR